MIYDYRTHDTNTMMTNYHWCACSMWINWNSVLPPPVCTCWCHSRWQVPVMPVAAPAPVVIVVCPHRKRKRGT